MDDVQELDELEDEIMVLGIDDTDKADSSDVSEIEIDDYGKIIY